MKYLYYFYALILSYTITLSATVLDDLAACAVQCNQLKIGELDALMQGYIVQAEKSLQELLIMGRNSSQIIALSRTKQNHEAYLRYLQQLQAKVAKFLTKNNTEQLMHLLISLHKVKQAMGQCSENQWPELSHEANQIQINIENLLGVTHLSVAK